MAMMLPSGSGDMGAGNIREAALRPDRISWLLLGLVIIGGNKCGDLAALLKDLHFRVAVAGRSLRADVDTGDVLLLICQGSSKIPDRVSGGVNMGKGVIIITCDIVGMAIVKMDDSSGYVSAFLIDDNWLSDNERVIDKDTKHYFDSNELHDDKLYKKQEVSKPLCIAP
nr:unnamed protein product [Callosobruchus chinensis]